MGILNNIKDIPFKGDEIIDIQFTVGVGVASIYFKSGKIISFHIDDENDSFTRKDYMQQVKINNRNLTIDKLTNENI